MGKKAAGERGVRICQTNNCADTKVNEEARKEVVQVLEQRFPCSPWRRPW